MPLTHDSQSLLLLCSHLGLSSDPEFPPLTLREWNPLARKLQAVSLRPADLLNLSQADLQTQLELSTEHATRITQLLERSGTLAIALERINNLGIFVLTRADRDYPERYRQRLKDSAPAVLFYAGEKALLGQPGIAVVGSRHLDEAGQECAKFVGNACGLSGQVLYSGGAKGVDTLSMESALEARGTAVSVLADSLERTVRSQKEALSRGDYAWSRPTAPTQDSPSVQQWVAIVSFTHWQITPSSSHPTQKRAGHGRAQPRRSRTNGCLFLYWSMTPCLKETNCSCKKARWRFRIHSRNRL